MMTLIQLKFKNLLSTVLMWSTIPFIFSCEDAISTETGHVHASGGGAAMPPSNAVFFPIPEEASLPTYPPVIATIEECERAHRVILMNQEQISRLNEKLEVFEKKLSNPSTLISDKSYLETSGIPSLKKVKDILEKRISWHRQRINEYNSRAGT